MQGYFRPSLKLEISKIDIEHYEGRPFKRMLIPKQSGGFRVAIQLDPVDTIIYTALAYEAANSVEAFRTPIDRRIACSYRVEISADGGLFRKNNGWDDFHNHSQELAQSGQYEVIATADIADFYNQIGHHRVRNALEAAGVTAYRAKNIENLLMNFTRGQSQGIPVGPNASIIFSEACLSDVDSYLLRKGYVHTRYVDDFRIFCKNKEEAYKAIHDLTEYLYTAHRLSLQSHKTRFLSSTEFLKDELINPEELENKTQEEKLEVLREFFSQYQEPGESEDTKINKIIRENLVELFETCINSQPMHLGTAKYILRRATNLRTGLLRDIVLENINKLSPVMREVTQYIDNTTKPKYTAEVGKKFIEGCATTELSFLPFMQIWLLELLQANPSPELEHELLSLCEKYRNNLGQRPYALLARENGYLDWVREQKETWHNNTPWDRRAVIWSAKALSTDERNYWLKRVQNAGDILDKAIAESVLNTENK
jgi:hypothetical protein